MGSVGRRVGVGGQRSEWYPPTHTTHSEGGGDLGQEGLGGGGRIAHGLGLGVH